MGAMPSRFRVGMFLNSSYGNLKTEDTHSAIACLCLTQKAWHPGLLRLGGFSPLERDSHLGDPRLQVHYINLLNNYTFLDGVRRSYARHLSEMHPGWFQANRGKGHIAS